MAVDSSKLVQLLLVGRTGNGKSSTGNFLLGSREFTPRSSSSSVNYEIKAERLTVDNVTVVVVDGPGIGDTSTDVTEGGQSMNSLVEYALSLISNQFDALLIVLKYGVRFTGQEKEAVKIIKMIFGEDVIKNYGIVILTHGDMFDMDTEDEGTTFEDWCERQTGDFSDLYNECDKRCVLFDNKSKDKRMEKVKQLLKIVADIKQIRPPYSEDCFTKAKIGRNKLTVMGKLKELEGKTEIILSKITKRLDEIGNKKQTENIDDLQKNVNELQTLSNDISDHKLWLDTEDNGTKSVEYLLLKISITESRVRNLKDLQTRRIEMANLERSQAHSPELASRDMPLQVTAQPKDTSITDKEISLQNTSAILQRDDISDKRISLLTLLLYHKMFIPIGLAYYCYNIV